MSDNINFKDFNSAYVHYFGPLTMGPAGSIPIDNIPLPDSLLCIREPLQEPVCSNKSGLKGSKNCDKCHDHSEIRKRYIKKHGSKKINEKCP